MLAYNILCHGNFRQVARLVEALYTPEDTFLIDIDDGKKPDTRALDKIARRENVHVVRDANICWGGSGTLRKTLKGAFSLLSLNRSWQYYVVISGQDLPLKSNLHIKEILSRGMQERRNFIRAVQSDPIAVEDVPLAATGNKCVQVGNRGHTKIFNKAGVINSQFSMYTRLMTQVTEVSERAEIYLETAEPILLRRRTAFFQRYPAYAGANWFNLHRSLIEHMQNDSFTYELYDVMRSCFIPDESFFQTYIMNSVFRETVSPDIGRLIVRTPKKPGVKVLGMEDLDTIQSGPELFGRKFDTGHDAKLVERVLSSR